MLVSKGQVSSVEEAISEFDGEGNVVLTGGIIPEQERQKAMIRRYSLHIFLKAKNSKKGRAETWLGFLSADGKNGANSVYTGRLHA